MTDRELMQQALEAFGEIAWSNNSQWQADRAKVAITALREALAEQPEQQHIEHCIWARSGNRPCPHVQPSKPWVGLTDEERHACTQSPFSADNYRAIEAKLKEKNT